MNQNILKLLETPLVPDAQAKVLSYFEEVKGSDTGWQLAITELTRTADNLSDHTKFFWWQIVENFVKTRYTQMDSASLLMRNFLFQWLHNMEQRNTVSYDNQFRIVFTYEDGIQEMRSAACILYRRFCKHFLEDGIQEIRSAACILYRRFCKRFLEDGIQEMRIAACILYRRFCKRFLEDGIQEMRSTACILYRRFCKRFLVVDREIPHSKEEADRNTLIKDTIRETCINDLVNSWYQICVLYEMSDSKLVSECLDVIGAYISWIDISLIANERFVTLFIRFMKDQHLREPDCDCLCEVVAKGMDSSAKVKLIESLYSLLHGAGVFVIDNEEDSDYLCKLGKLINTMGVQLAVSWTRRVVGLMMCPAAYRTMLKWTPINERILFARLATTYTKFSVIVCYAPTNEADDDVKDSFYETLQAVTKDIPKHDVLCVVGDLNAKVGADRKYCPEVLGPHGLDQINENGSLLVDFEPSNDLVVDTMVPNLRHELHKGPTYILVTRIFT
ncbi:hypothetical protein QYM36_005917 [Artemia franciscana]|uniref:Exportin-T n=1 Tax=Artemia franciscana TaxID=6661 RepID=A0AA88ICM4_ARTSF|nr:hypothetical protein QYM36_005917 [Artemia franciscana]